MRVKSWSLAVVFLLVIGGCSSPPRFTVDKEVWSGEANGGNQKVFVRLTFTQSGDAVEGKLELGQSQAMLAPTKETLKGTLIDHALAVSTASSSESVTGTFSQDEAAFSGTLTLLIEDVKENFVLTMNVQQAQ